LQNPDQTFKLWHKLSPEPNATLKRQSKSKTTKPATESK